MSTTPLAQGQAGNEIEIAGPMAPKANLARREPVPKELAALGVVIAVDPESDMQMLIIPKALREKANVLAPVQAFQQADANWRPSLRVVELDPDPMNGPHFYKQQGGKVAPRKQALELLADAAGVVQISTNLLGRERVEIGGVISETFTHIAILKIRKSDGTLRTLEASRTYEPFAEYEEIKTSVGSGNYAKTPGTPDFDAEVRKRWLNEVKFAKAKNESKAINRAFRSAIQIPQTFTPQRAALPFVVVGWNLAPQDSGAVQSAIAQLYGAAASEPIEAPLALDQGWDAPPEESEQEIVPEDGPVVSFPPFETAEPSQQAPTESAVEVAPVGAPDAQDSPADPVEVAERESAVAGDTPGVVEEPPAPPAEPLQDATVVPATDEQEAEATTPPASASDQPVEQTPASALSPAEFESLPRALAVKWPSGSYQDRTIGWTLEQGESADEWLAYGLRQPWPHDPDFKRALMLACKAHRPEMYAEFRKEARA